MRKILTVIFLTFLAISLCSAQSDRKNVRQGNRNFRKADFQEAEINYKKALVADSSSVTADYNLGNTYYRLENYTEADKFFNAAADSLSKGKHGSDLYHNMGNSLVRQEKYQEAIEAYKNALRRNPDDMQTKENLAYAQKMLKDQQQNQDQNQNNNDQNQDQNKDQNQDQNKDQNDDQNKDQNKDKNDDQNKDQNKDKNDDQNKDNPGQQPPQGGQQPKISPQAAQQMLQAMQAQEKDTQEKVKKEKALKMQSRQKEKNW